MGSSVSTVGYGFEYSAQMFGGFRGHPLMGEGSHGSEHLTGLSMILVFDLTFENLGLKIQD